jgi:transposase-like protein
MAENLRGRSALYDWPAEHWIHLRTTNPIESVFATVRHRTVRTKGSLLCNDNFHVRVASTTMTGFFVWA